MSCEVSRDLCVKQNTDYVETLVIRDANGSLVDLTGNTFVGKCRPSIDSMTTYSFTFTISNQITNTGEVVMRIPNTLFNALTLTKDVKYPYGVKWTDSTSRIWDLLEGYVIISPDAAR